MNKNILPLFQELVSLNVRRWDVERRIEREIFGGAELDFMGSIYDNHVSYLTVACGSPEDAYHIVKAKDAKRFLEALKEQISDEICSADGCYERTTEGGDGWDGKCGNCSDKEK
jgi:hypothetical protein